jgi:CRISPR/Cas system Type II protein with McrA/HNH and RuvC-like nuclease domain
MKKILGLDLGTNSIGWALIEKPENEQENGKILGMGSRIILLGNDKTNFEQGQKLTRNADRRKYRGSRRLNKRYKLRRNKLIYVLKELGMLPDFIKWDGDFPEPTKLQTLSIKPIDKRTEQLKSIELFELRKKALYNAVDNKNFGRILYMFNQHRGYAGGAGEDEEEDKLKNDKKEEQDETTIKKYEVKVETVKIKTVPKEIGKVKSKRKKDEGKEIPEFEVTVITKENIEYTGTTLIDFLKVNEDFEILLTIRRNKKGEITSVKFSIPKKSNWRVEFEKLEKEFKENGEPYISELFLGKLKENPWYRVRNHVIQRWRYKKEFDAIWDEQAKHCEILNSTPKETLEKIAKYVFPGKSESQKRYREDAINQGLKYIIKEQIIYYQRPLKPQIKLIANCRFEKNLKVIPKSHPLYQEYRIWQQINNLSINTVEEINGKKQYNDRPLTQEQKKVLYETLQNQKEITHKSVCSKLKLREKIDYLNGLHIKSKLKGNETKLTIKKILGDFLWNKIKFEDSENLTELWRILYNWLRDDNFVFDTKDYEKEPEKYQMYNPNNDNEYDLNSDRIKTINEWLKTKLGNDNEMIKDELLIKMAKLRFKRTYGALSAKAISNLLPLMNPFIFNDNMLSNETKSKIEKIKNGEADDSIDDNIRDYYLKYPDCIGGTGLMASYSAMLVYGKHTAEEYTGIDDYHNIKTYEQLKIENPENADKITLRNPVVEQVTNETLQIIKSIWKQYKIKPDEIRIELARELKNNADERNKIYKAVINNEKINNRIKERLIEMNINTSLINIERYKLWEIQNKISPYTGQPIPINNEYGLFSNEYEVDHIIPRSRFFDDSLTNKVICETAVNKDKGNRTAWEYIVAGSDECIILNQEDFIKHTNENFFGRKRKNLLLKEIPKDFVERQKKDTQYITIKVKEELGKIVGTNKVKTTTGGITDYLKQIWGLNDIFKELTKKRYEMMGKRSNENWIEYITDNKTSKKFLKIKNWSKRFDHRHHALDALVVACTEQSHIQRLNNLNKELQTWIRENKDKIKENFKGTNEELFNEFLNLSKEIREKIIEKMPSFRQFDIPWKQLTEQVENNLKSLIVSFKSKQTILYQKDKTGKDILSVKGALHDETYYGKGETYRLPISKLASKKDVTKFIKNKVLSKTIREDLLKHLGIKDPKEAFSDEGIAEFNKSRKHPIRAIRVRYAKEGKDEGKLQPLNKKHYPEKSIFVKTGGNYCFAVAEKDDVRKFGIISFFDAVDIIKNSNEKNIQKVIQEYFEKTCETTKDCTLLFTLSSNELVYLPKPDEENIPVKTNDERFEEYWKNIDTNRIFRVVKSTGSYCYFAQHNLSQQINYSKINIENANTDKQEIKTEKFNEFGSNDGCCPFIYVLENGDFHQNNKLNKILTGKTISIQDYCIKIHVDRLGNIKPEK